MRQRPSKPTKKRGLPDASSAESVSFGGGVVVGFCFGGRRGPVSFRAVNPGELARPTALGLLVRPTCLVSRGPQTLKGHFSFAPRKMLFLQGVHIRPGRIARFARFCAVCPCQLRLVRQPTGLEGFRNGLPNGSGGVSFFFNGLPNGSGGKGGQSALSLVVVLSVFLFRGDGGQSASGAVKGGWRRVSFGVVFCGEWRRVSFRGCEGGRGASQLWSWVCCCLFFVLRRAGGQSASGL